MNLEILEHENGINFSMRELVAKRDEQKRKLSNTSEGGKDVFAYVVNFYEAEIKLLIKYNKKCRKELEIKLNEYEEKSKSATKEVEKDIFSNGINRYKSLIEEIDKDMRNEEERKNLTNTNIQNFYECVICLDNEKQDNTYDLLCGHVFHETCIKLWIRNHNTCPICRKKLSAIHIECINRAIQIIRI